MFELLLRVTDDVKKAGTMQKRCIICSGILWTLVYIYIYIYNIAVVIINDKNNYELCMKQGRRMGMGWELSLTLAI